MKTKSDYLPILFTINLIGLLITINFLFGSLYTALVPILSFVYLLINYLGIYNNSEITNHKSLGQFFKDKFKSRKFHRNVTIVFLYLILL